MFGKLFNDTEVYATLKGLPRRYRADIWLKYFHRDYFSRF